MTDRELLELSAKAAGYNMAKVLDGYPMYMEGYGIWNPLTDDGDALRLAVKLQLNFNWEDFNTIDVWCSDTCKNATEEFTDDPYAATRKAIVRAAAQIGQSM
jgi:hypothetical protein